MSVHEKWREMATELGFELIEGLASLLETPVAQELMTGQTPQGKSLPALKLLDNPVFRSLLEQVFVGLTIGTHRGCEAYVFPSGPVTEDGDNYVNVVLKFPRPLGIGLQIYREKFWQKLGKLLGAQDIQTGDPELDRRVVVKSSDPPRATRLLEGQAAQEVLRTMFGADNYRVADDRVQFAEQADALEAFYVRDILDLMADLQEALARGS